MSGDLKLFARYVCPSMAGMVIAGSYSIVDTIFIGQGTGKIGLAAIALTWPLIMIVCAVGDWLGSGAAVLISQARGAGQILRARRIFSNALLLEFLMSAAMCAFVIPYLEPALRFLGADDIMMPYALPYAKIMMWGSFVTVFSMSCVSIIRNDGSPLFSMWIVVIGLSGNIVLDWLFIIKFGWGARGAAWATIASEAFGSILAAAYFLSPFTKLRVVADGFGKFFEFSKNILATGFPIFGNVIAIIAMLLMHNAQSLRYGGVDGLAAYTLVAALESLGSMLMTGLAGGVQPLVAYIYGAGDVRRQNKIGNYGYFSAFVVGFLLMVFSFAMRDFMPALAGLTGHVAQLAAHGVLISSTAFILLGVIRVASFYYQSTGKIFYSSLLIYGDAFFALPLCLFTLPIWFGMDGVWLAMPLSRLVLFAILCWLWFGTGRHWLALRQILYDRFNH